MKNNSNNNVSKSSPLGGTGGGLRIAIYTLTRDRLEYTKHCFKSLSKNAGMDYDHYVLDNGSTDGTAEWLKDQPTSDRGGCQFKAFLLPENIGISAGSNMMLDEIFKSDYDLIIKMDNDCEVWHDNILVTVSTIFQALNNANQQMVLSPRVSGISRQPHRARYIDIIAHPIGITGIIGGLFHIVPAEIYKQYRYPLQLPKAWGQDDDFCEWLRLKDIPKGYIEDVVVNHYETSDGQAARYPAYFERKWKEEKKEAPTSSPDGGE
jgi:GT2 family glycosyltransferase